MQHSAIMAESIIRTWCFSKWLKSSVKLKKWTRTRTITVTIKVCLKTALLVHPVGHSNVRKRQRCGIDIFVNHQLCSHFHLMKNMDL